ncbi:MULTISPECIES: hypothetical protein [unclassified Pseudoxanthomonas]|jgi:hypothetical protein|uniref:hypothetical protein n=1 Tax=unclassified Pseudoxanthomonas TaxID=2645906 RepID=UPI003076E712
MQHQFTWTGRVLPDCSDSQRPLTHWQDEISWNPHIPIWPLAAHCARTAWGSVGLSLLTQAGIVPQQLPTSFTAQSLLLRQL